MTLSGVTADKAFTRTSSGSRVKADCMIKSDAEKAEPANTASSKVRRVASMAKLNLAVELLTFSSQDLLIKAHSDRKNTGLSSTTRNWKIGITRLLLLGTLF